VHWVAIVPECQGIGLGKALMTLLCQRLRELGHDQAYLFTSSERVSAIRLYLRFGFELWPGTNRTALIGAQSSVPSRFRDGINSQ
jgi:GNAT superfamily N-acetyltransferase